jgi:hypothetical protein
MGDITMFKRLFGNSKPTTQVETHKPKPATEALKSKNHVAKPKVECYLLMRQRLGHFNVNDVFNKDDDETFKDNLQYFNELCGIYSTWPEARRGGRTSHPASIGIFEVGYPAEQVPKLITDGYLSQILISGCHSPFIDENRVVNPNFNPNLIPPNPSGKPGAPSPA